MSYPVTPPRRGAKRPTQYHDRRESIEPLLYDSDMEYGQDSPSPTRSAKGSSSPGNTLRQRSTGQWRRMSSHGTASLETPKRPRQPSGPKQPSPAHARTSAVAPWLKYEEYVPMPPPPPLIQARQREQPAVGLFPGGLGAVGARFQDGLDACTSTLRRVASTSGLATLPRSPPSPHMRRGCQTMPIMRRKAAQKIAIPSVIRQPLRRPKHGSTSPKKSPRKISPETKARALQRLAIPEPLMLESPFRLRN